MRNIFFVLAVLFTSCVSENNHRLDYYKDVDVKMSSFSNTIKELDIDTVVVDNIGTMSGDGFWKVRLDTLYYFDRLLAVVDAYNDTGKFQYRALGIGRGPGEVQEEIGMVCDFESGWLLSDIYSVYKFNRTFNLNQRKFLFQFDKNFKNRKQELLKNPSPNKDLELYVPAYEYPQMDYLKEKSVLMKICCEYPDCRERKFYEESAIIGVYDFNKGTLTELMGAYPPCYHGDIFPPAFSNHYYSKYKNGKYLLSFGVDSLIYVCDDKFKPVRAFGRKGNFKNVDYIMTNIKRMDKENYDFQNEVATRGHYTSIYYDNEKDVIFRVYKTGVEKEKTDTDVNECSNPSRMQIYRGEDLIGDVSVPDRFEIISYSSPYYYADGYLKMNDEDDKLGIYKFKL